MLAVLQFGEGVSNLPSEGGPNQQGEGRWKNRIFFNKAKMYKS